MPLRNQLPLLLRTRFLTISPVVAGLLLATASLSARADDHIRAVRLSNVVGSVQILSGTETQFSQAYPNMPLMEGSTLKTGEDGRAEIQLEDGSVVRLTPNSSVAMSVLRRHSDGNSVTEVDLLSGLNYVEMKGTANQRFVVHFNNDEVISPAPVKFRVKLDSDPVEFAVLDGSAHLSGGNAFAVDVKMGETVRFDSTDASRYFLAQGVDSDSWDQWNADRDRAMGALAAMETREARGSANPGDPSLGELDAYGNWYSGANGSFWVPSGAGPGWDPYGSGYWGYYGNTGGYVWISGYPWGWLPYQCGNWNYYGTVGWGWAPIGCGSGWYPGGGIGYAPPRYRRLPTPGPVGGSRLHPLIAVNRGPEATKLEPGSGVVPKTVTVNGQPAQLLAKTVNPTNTLAARTTVLNGRPSSGIAGGAQLGSVPVYRPSAPTLASSGGVRPVGASSFAGHAGGGPVSAPGFSAPSSAGAGASHAGSMGGGAPSGGSVGGGASAGGHH